MTGQGFIEDLPDANGLDLSDRIIVNQGTTPAVTRKGTLTQLASLIGGGGGGVTPWIFKDSSDDGYNLVTGDKVLADTSESSFSMILPSSPNVGDEIIIGDNENMFSTNNLTIDRNNNSIEDQNQNLIANTNNILFRIIWNGSTWKVFI